MTTVFENKLVFLKESIKAHAQVLAAGAWFIATALIGFPALLVCLYLLTTTLWWLVLIYFTWVFLDRNTCENGGRPCKYIQKWTWWRYVRDYFSAKVTLVPNFTLNPKKNYLFCCFPHGVLPASCFTGLASEWSQFKEFYPNFQIRMSVLKLIFFLPISRDLGLAVGGISCSSKSLETVLSKPEGGYGVTLYVGGAEEAVHSLPGQYKCVVKKRKGFVRIALKTGAPLIPVFTFNETNLFDQIRGPRITQLQMLIKKMFGFIPIIFRGRGLFQNSFGLIPRKTELVTVVGSPIEVIKNKNPTDAEIDTIHQRFLQELNSLFEKYKFDYLENPENIRLEIV